jgi:hypothetical protein
MRPGRAQRCPARRWPGSTRAQRWPVTGGRPGLWPSTSSRRASVRTGPEAGGRRGQLGMGGLMWLAGSSVMRWRSCRGWPRLPPSSLAPGRLDRGVQDAAGRCARVGRDDPVPRWLSMGKSMGSSWCVEPTIGEVGFPGRSHPCVGPGCGASVLTWALDVAKVPLECAILKCRRTPTIALEGAPSPCNLPGHVTARTQSRSRRQLPAALGWTYSHGPRPASPGPRSRSSEG